MKPVSQLSSEYGDKTLQAGFKTGIQFGGQIAGGISIPAMWMKLKQPTEYHENVLNVANQLDQG